MPAEWDPHERCYLVWPERNDTWRMGAKPAQAAFLDVAEAIARSEPVTMLVSARQWEHARASCSDAISVVEMSTDDAWIRGHRPHVRGQPAGRGAAGGRLAVQCVGRTRGRALLPVGRRRPGGGQGVRPRGLVPLPGPTGARRGFDPRRRRGDLHHHRGVPPPSQSQSRSVPPGDRVAAGGVPGSGEGDLDPTGGPRRRDGRSCRQPCVLLASGTCATDLERGAGRPPVRDLPGGAGGARVGDRCPRSTLGGRPAAGPRAPCRCT